MNQYKVVQNKSWLVSLLGYLRAPINDGTKVESSQKIKGFTIMPPVHNTLSDAVKQTILDVINQPEYSPLTPHQIVPTLLGSDQYIASKSTFYRVMREHNQIKHRGKGTASQRKKPQPLKATTKNHPERWNGRETRNLEPIDTVYLNPGKGQKKANENTTQIEEAA